jgi:uncharacterized protein HemY
MCRSQPVSPTENSSFAVREATLILAAAIEPGQVKAALATRLRAILDRNDVVAARNRLERLYGIRPLPISND